MAAKKKTAVSPLMKKLSTYIAGAVKKSPPKHVVRRITIWNLLSG
jgi:hypothetical protein